MLFVMSLENWNIQVDLNVSDLFEKAVGSKYLA